MMTKAYIGPALLCLLALCIASNASAADQKGELSPLVIATADAEHHFEVELADTGESRERGLMFRRALERDRGMLFDFRRDRVVSMWMKNTLIPLDMLFIRKDGRITRIHARAVPGSLAGISSVKPVRAVLELAGGTASKLGIKVGDRVRHRMFDKTE